MGQEKHLELIRPGDLHSAGEAVPCMRNTIDPPKTAGQLLPGLLSSYLFGCFSVCCSFLFPQMLPVAFCL